MTRIVNATSPISLHLGQEWATGGSQTHDFLETFTNSYKKNYFLAY